MKPRFNIEDYKDDYVMHCNTEEKANVFCKYLNSVGRKWNSDCSYLEVNEWAYYEEDTCYNFNYGTFCDYNSYCIDYTILEFNNFDWSEEEKKENNMKNFTKSDLQNGMVVETREDRFMVVGDKIINNYGFMALSSYEENLTLTEGDDDFDIIKIYDKITSFNRMNYLEELRLLWERQEEMKTKKYIIEQEYIDENYKLIEDITILPNNPRGYRHSDTSHPISIMKDGDFALSLTTDSAKEVIKALQEIVGYIEK